jgi:hypothetical protein
MRKGIINHLTEKKIAMAISMVISMAMFKGLIG